MANVYRPPTTRVEVTPQVVHAYLRRIPGQWRSATDICKHFKLPVTDRERGNMVCNCTRLEEKDKVEHTDGPDGRFVWRVPPPSPKTEYGPD